MTFFLSSGIIRPSEGLHARYPVEDYLDLFDLPAHHIQYQMLANRTAGVHRADIIIGIIRTITLLTLYWDVGKKIENIKWGCKN